MKKNNVFFILILMVSMLNAQDKSSGVILEPFQTARDDYAHFNGPVKAVHYQAYHISDVEGKVVKGNPYTLEEAQHLSWEPESFYFNEKGQLTYINFLFDDGIRATGVVHHRDSEVRDIYWIRSDTLRGRQSFMYPGDEIVKMRWIRVSDNKTMGGIDYTLNNKGAIIKSEFKNVDGETGYTMEYVRDDKGRILSRLDTKQGGKVNIDYVNYKYNEKGLFKTAYMNVVVGEERNEQMGDIEYEYDEYGNWIKRISPGWMMVERTIEYYE